MASSMKDLTNEFGAPTTGKTRMEEAMTCPTSVAGLWVASEAHTGMECQEVIKDPPAPNSIEFGGSVA